ncbi:TAXI family TRAP transporter solute-binding subunit [Hyphomicrobiales bacterium]|jgi:TRAP transporter TAXI family solute receptor|nr:TAXI family TRAP transporter solute-binding subunit [Rhodobiaceae bacterium]MDB4127969.1 TAXI family TRAP transporter solute-binding subunit [Hyphomicrobiales bacterium]MBT5640024.1 TAXI family TRAP transporter solute-binding subunit [Rhodobiaceae bacterium]MBT6222997.1 TAXI family TRAP transporter solute-binding subunit [Rhodobiaceae bacterium]MDC0139667.1 TAXI family TRAP transporter solute-binding subunit [Hyphomicrobiales bacterium]|tara:strand:- start:303 stop:1280 length:978 start_codon:yes stop_codon:yes gene_type:complete
MKFKILSVALLSSVLSLGTASATEFMSIGTGGPTGVYFQVGNAVCQMVHREAAEGRSSGRQHGYRCSAPSTAGSIYNIKNIESGELQFGVAQSDWQYHATNGTSKFEGAKVDDLRSVFSVHPEPFQILVGKNTGIESWADLEGKTVNIGNPGSGQRGTFEVLMDANGVGTEYFGAAAELTSSEQSSALCNGDIDAYGYTVGVPNAGVSQAADGCGATIINLNNDAVTGLVNDNPFYAFATIPTGTYSTITSNVTTFGVKASFVTSANVNADMVYEVVRAVFSNFDAFKSLHPAFANLSPLQMMSEGNSAPLHEGAIRYYKERGWM